MSSYILDLRYRGQEVGGAVSGGTLYWNVGEVDYPWDSQTPEFEATTRGRRLLVLIHGYNNSRTVGRQRLLRFGAMLRARGFGDVILSVLWPGDGWAKALTYPFEGRDADDSADALSRWLSTHARAVDSIAFVGHSLGCRVAMRAATNIARAGTPRLDQVCLMAPAIDNDSLGRTGTTCYRTASLATHRVAVLASKQDRVLQLAYPLGDLLQTVLFGERWGRALGRTGPQERDQEVLQHIQRVPLARRERDVDHGDYLDVSPGAPDRTIAETEAFVVQLLAHVPDPRWPAQSAGTSG
jgi:pimeloyl-ACP methyl ester carboxylesterase